MKELSCPVPSAYEKDPRFQELLKEYPKFDDERLANLLELCRKRYGYEDDWYPDTPAKKSVFTKFRRYHLTFEQLADKGTDLTKDSLYNLYSTLYSLYSPEMLDQRLNHIAYYFEKILDKTEEEHPSLTRQQILTSLGDENENGYKKIMRKVWDEIEKRADEDFWYKAFYDEYFKATGDEQRAAQVANLRKKYRAAEYKKMLVNKERLTALVAPRIGEEEGFIVNIHNFEVTFEKPAEVEDSMQEGQDNDSENTGEDKGEGTKGERYGDFRTIKLMESLLPQVKRFLRTIPKVNSKGRIQHDDLGVVQRVGARQAAVVLKRVLQNSDSESMMSDLEAASDSYPWIKGLVEVLEKDPDKQSYIFGLSGAATTYVYTNFEDGSYVSHIANTKSAGYALAREAANNLMGGNELDPEKSIYTGYGSLKSREAVKKIRDDFADLYEKVRDAFKFIRMVSSDDVISDRGKQIFKERWQKKYGESADWFDNDKGEAAKAFFEANPTFIPRIVDALRGLGFQITEEDIHTIAEKEISEKTYEYLVNGATQKEGRNYIYHLVDWIDSAYAAVDNIWERGLEASGEYLYNTTDIYKGINKCLAISKYNELEDRVLNEGKSLSTVNNTNLLHQVADELANKRNLDEMGYLQMLNENYNQYEGMALGFGKDRRAVGWLKRLAEDKNWRRDLRVVNSVGFNHVEYQKMSKAQKITSALMMFFNGQNIFGMGGYHLVEVPIQADYETANDYVTVPHMERGEIVEALVDEVLVEIERIASIQQRQKDKGRAKLEVYERQGQKFQIFPEFNSNGFLSTYTKIEDSNEAKKFIEDQVNEQLDKIIAKDRETFTKSGILSNPLLTKVGKHHNFYTEDGQFDSLADENKEALDNYFISSFYNRMEITKIFTGGLQQFDGLIDYEKRNMMLHAPHTSLYTKATWNGERVGKDTQRVVYVNDDKAGSAFLEEIQECLQQLFDEKVITEKQYKTMLAAYSNINTTDGQGFRTLESYRTVKIMAGEWDKIHERAYNRIISGNPKSSDIQVFMQNIKPVFTGYETIAAADGVNQKPIKNTVLHKYSEAVLLPLALAQHCMQAKSAPLQALARAQEALKRKGQDVDMFLFHSGCKVGAHSTLSPFAKWKDIKGDESIGQTDEEARKARGWNGQDLNDRIVSSVDDMSDYIVNTVTADKNTVHTLDFKYYGIAASTPVHLVDDKISWASQAEKVAWANIEEGDKITVRGKSRSAKAMRELYNQIKTAAIIESYNEIREIFSNPAELERIFQEELANKSYNSRELTYALARLKDGTFALPLFSPNVEHQVAQLFSSIIKKRLTKPRAKGSNILQATGLGMDMEAHGFDESKALSNKDKLKVVWEGRGKNRRIKYVEVYMPLHDSRLEMFADEDGVITAERLEQLVADGTIPSEMLNFIAYRTPSDAEHSVIPCRIKGFIANTGGATIIMPKEVMVMTGHDYDGDKMRCHFANFTVGWNEKKLREAYDNYNKGAVTNMMRQVLGLKADEKPVLTYEEFTKRFKKAEKERMSNEYRAINYTAYDYNKSAIDNSQEARDNAKIELMFAKLTSPEGTRKMLIPGGCEDTSVIAKTMYLVRLANDVENRGKIQDALVKLGVSEDKAKAAVRNTNTLYDILTRMNDKQISDVVRSVSDAVSPFTVTHEADAFETIMGGAELIGIYALYNSAFQMFQRLDLKYIQKKTQNGKSYDLSLFGHKWGDAENGLHLFDVRNHRGRLASLSLARLVNAAVDNNKNPILGYLNQSKDMAEITFMMLAAGMTEEEVHLVMNQPAVIELINRLKGRESEGLDAEAKKLIDQLTNNKPQLKSLNTPSTYAGVQEAAKIKREDYIRMLSIPFERVDAPGDDSIVKNQAAILQTLRHINSSAKSLAQFVRLTRPETDSGALDSSVEGIVADTIELNNFRNELNKAEGGVLNGISGMNEVLRRRQIEYGYSVEAIEDILGTLLPEVVALNSLMIDSSLDIFQSYYPQARASWVNAIAELADQYSYKTMQPGVVKKIATEMILWKLLSDKRFVQGNSQEEQKRIIVDVPNTLKSLKRRIADAEKHKGEDPAADALVGNAFLDNLFVRKGRLRFTLNGPAVEGTSDLIRASWSELLVSDDESIRQLGVDLFKYNMYTNGFGYGMYEFAHFAPFSVILSTPGYREALQDILTRDWNDDADLENFVNQYYMNHWGDNKFLKKYKITDLNVEGDPEGNSENLVISEDEKGYTEAILDQRYIIVTSGKDNKTQTLYRVEKSGNNAILIKAQKLGVRNKNQQVTLQYNPAVWYTEIQPVVAGNDTAWGSPDNGNARDPYAQADVNAPQGYNIPTDPGYSKSLSAFDAYMLKTHNAKKQAEVLKKKEEKAEAQEQKNNEVLDNDTTESGRSKSEATNVGGLAGFLGKANADVDLSAARPTDGQMLSIVTEDADGKIETKKVPATPDNIRKARKLENFVRLNKKLREILRKAGVDVGVLTDAEAMMSIGGIADFDTAKVTAEGLVELIRIANGYRGEQALPEEFAHVALEMLGHDHPLVQRLLNALYNNREAMEEAFGSSYAEYEKIYGKDNMDKLVLEAAGKLVAKNLLREQEIQNRPIRNLIHRIVAAIKNLLRKFRREDIQEAMFEADRVASKVARDLLGGRLLDSMSLENISINDKLYAKVQKDLSQKEDLLSKLLKIEVKRLSIFKKRYGYDQNKGAKSLAATELQISKLESAIRNYKAEDAVVTYMQDSLLFLQQTYESLQKVVDSGRPANIICRKLNTVRDTLYSFSAALEAIDKSLQDGEIQDTVNLRNSINEMSGVLNKFNTYYETVARSYFEDMLSNIYGEHGITVTVGREKGRVITIHEMATKTDGNISMAARWFNSLADCNDYALKAIDDLTRSVKIDARNRMLDVMPRLELAVANLKKETGSTDQDFMFEKDASGKRTGRYITEDEANNLSPARRDFYKTVMAIKHEADDCLPDSLVEDRKMVMVRKYTMDRIKDANGIRGKLVAAWEGVKNSVLDTSDDIDFENQEVAVDFENNKVDMLPVKFCMKGKKESYDDMSDDVASSIAAYAGMAFEYDGLNGVINILENAKYMASEREVLQKTGTRQKRETIETDDYIYHKPFTVKQANTRIQDLLEDYFQMHIYGHLQKAEGTFGRTRLSKRKVVDTVNHLTSLSQMAINIPQRIANVNTGLTQIFIESVGKGVFTARDVAWASKIYIKESGDRLAETGKTDVDNKLSLFAEYFDIHQNNGRNQVKYKKGRMSRIFNQSLLYAGLTMGEDYLALTTALAAARNIKINYKDKSGNVKTGTLWDAYEVKYLDAKNKTGAYLALKPGVTKEDGSALTAEDEKKYGKLVAGMNFQLQGIYNTDDRSAVQQYAFGALIIMYRKWIAPALKRRYAGTQYNTLRGDYEEGYYRTLFRLMGDIVKDTKNQVTEEQGAKALLNIVDDMKALRNSIVMNWSKMTPYEKSNVKRSITELCIVAGLYLACALASSVPPSDDDDDRSKMLKWWDKTVLSQMFRLRSEIGSQAPTPMMVDEAMHILNSPFAAIKPLQNMMDSFQLLIPSNYLTEVKQGRYRGHSKAYKYFRELPVISMFKKVDNFIDPSPLINYYKNDAL